MAGHSQFKNIMHRKGQKDAMRSKIFSKLSREITISAKLSGQDPLENPRLRVAIQNAKNQSMPKENIERAIAKASSSDSENYINIRYEGYGPEGIAIIIETLTDNRNRTASNIRSIFTKASGSLGETGSSIHFFDQIGEIVYHSTVADYDLAMEAAIDADANEFFTEDNEYVFHCDFENIGQTSKILEKHLGEAISLKTIWKPKNIIQISDEEAAKSIIKMIKTLEEDDDVQNLYSNFDISDDILKKINCSENNK
ncbi:MAG: YebC/PmpR family DNA-binding transcriptional regulator [Candidatus Liberibacter europaeus]|uniref:Probable transcriptional regulatory protein C4617_00310 n=1 Tax=Candidatus Liberibacter europaeus TaxID=744859 RepID=A0A2T4VYP4_9HYPH|nr:YebC/PmpR family DNA-binding transcriptional regulator [Candidatus Liberibacter europaeus]PTL86907.1 MAG: YebC/PmpR family DNA-binding transcriptional regulator [Candidatus Liberibacter europaeus]